MLEERSDRVPAARERVLATVNGKPMELAPMTSVADLVRHLSARQGAGRAEGAGTAVAINSGILTRSEWSSTFIQPGDVVEILTAAAGG